MARKKRLSFLLGLIIVFGLPSIVQSTEWERITKPYKIGPVAEISVSYYGTKQYIFAAGDSSSNILWMTTDGGQTWTENHDVPGYWHTR